MRFDPTRNACILILLGKLKGTVGTSKCKWKEKNI
jgi:hypothetical protein